MGGKIWVDKRVLLRHSGSYVFCQENQQYLIDNIGPMYVKEQEAKATAASQITPGPDGNVTLKVS
jgi:hypothetical protein